MSIRSQKSTWLTRGVLAIGAASLFSDVGHEMATAILPVFMVSLGGTAAALGVIEGVADFLSSIAKLYAGYFGTKTAHKKWGAGAGYIVTALAKGGMAFATVWPHLLVARTIGWIGRGFRTPLRDALLAEQVDRRHFGKAYGLERAMDSAGAVLGPLVTLTLVACLVSFKTILLLTLIPGLLAAGLILVGVREKVESTTTLPSSQRAMPVSFRRFLVAVGLFGCGDFSRTLLILWAAGDQISWSDPGQITLPIMLYVGYNVVQSISSYVGGAISDRVGRKSVLLFGYSAAVVVTLLMVLDIRSTPMMIVVFAGSGIYMGIQEAVERATAADMLPTASRSLGFGWLAAVNGVGDLLASLSVGVLWSCFGTTLAFTYAAALMLFGTILLATLPAAKSE